MTHPATRRAILAFLTAIDLPVDIGIVHPPDENGRSRAWWQRRALTSADVLQLMPRLGRENAAGAAIYVRAFIPAGMGDDDPSPGLVLIDDLSAAAVASLRGDGIETRAVVETSPGNFQAWLKLPSNSVTNAGARMVARSLAEAYGGDPKAVAFAQPGRLPGFTNRKERHRRPDGSAPFVLLRSTCAGATTKALKAYIDAAGHPSLTHSSQPARAAGAAETPSAETSASKAIAEIEPAVADLLEGLGRTIESRLSSQVAAGRRSASANSASEVDFGIAVAALETGIDRTAIIAWLAGRRRAKPESYAGRTVAAACHYLLDRPNGRAP